MASITLLAVEEPGTIYSSDEIRTLLESHIEFLKKSPQSTFFGINAQLVYKYRGDFYGLMGEMGVLPQYHWLMMRMNGYTSPFQLDDTRHYFIQPNFTFVEQIINLSRGARSLN